VSERWLVAMSGGVDSSIAAALLARAGHEVVGVTMDLGAGSADGTSARGPSSGDDAPRSAKKCCGLPDAEDARDVARALGIRHYTANYRDEFRAAVIDPFVAEYAAGRTPIPCIACNRVLKFDLLLRRADALGACGVATGHYARIAPAPDGGPGLFRPHDREKDQTYFLFDLPRATLARIRFPLGELEKSEVRALARELGLSPRKESQHLFVPDGDVRVALARLAWRLGAAPGPIGRRQRARHAHRRDRLHAGTTPRTGLVGRPLVRAGGPPRGESPGRRPRGGARGAQRAAARHALARLRATGRWSPRRGSTSTQVRVGTGRGRTRRNGRDPLRDRCLGAGAGAGRGRLRRGRRAATRRRVDHWRGRVSGAGHCAGVKPSFARPGCNRRSRRVGGPAIRRGEAARVPASVLGVAELLMAAFPEASEGALSRARAQAVNQAALAAHARDLGLDDLVLLGKSEKTNDGRGKPSILADAFEAVLGALYLDAGFEKARAFVARELAAELQTARAVQRDAKTELQEALQAAGREPPRYVTVSESGPSHAPAFSVEARVGAVVYGAGAGRSKQAAEQAAAQAALRVLASEPA
jgi:ribonuclease III